IGDIHQTNEMDALLIEAVPASALCTFPIALEILLPVVTEHVVLTGHKVDLSRGCSFQYLVQRVELARLRELTQITGVNDEIRFVRHGIDFVDCRLQSSRDVRICRLVKTDVAVADLHKAEVPAFAGTSISSLGECQRHRNTP